MEELLRSLEAFDRRRQDDRRNGRSFDQFDAGDGFLFLGDDGQAADLLFALTRQITSRAAFGSFFAEIDQ